jgi:hypothetical protein
VYEQPAASRRFGPTLIALLVVLATVAGTMGYLVARQIIIDRAGAKTNVPGALGDVLPGDLKPTGSPATLTGTTPVTGAPVSTSPSPSDSGMSCPALTEKAVREAGLAGGLTLLRYVHVDGASSRDSDAEAWVCRNKDGVLVYQGHVRSGPFNAVLSDSTLLLVKGVRGYVEPEGDGFVAVNPSGLTKRTEYHVSRTELVVVNRPGGSTTHYPVISTYPAG